MRKRWVYVDGQAYDADAYVREPRSTSYQVMPDIQPYVSMIDGSVINSRSVHRDHLRQHGCFEVGNDSSLHQTPKPLKSPPGLKDALIRAAHQHLRSK